MISVNSDYYEGMNSSFQTVSLGKSRRGLVDELRKSAVDKAHSAEFQGVSCVANSRSGQLVNGVCLGH